MINHFIYTNIETTNNNKIFQDFKFYYTVLNNMWHKAVRFIRN